MLLRENKTQEAESSVRRALEVDPSLADAQTTLGVILARVPQLRQER